MNYKLLLAGAISGCAAALVVDINAWSKSKKPFDWGLAIRRWIAGAVSGAAAAAGFGVV
jgi:hypothetical protein